MNNEPVICFYTTLLPSITYCLFLFIYVNCACTFYVNMLWQRCIVCNLKEGERERKREREREQERETEERGREEKTSEAVVRLFRGRINLKEPPSHTHTHTHTHTL